MLNFERFRVQNAAGFNFDLNLRNRGLVRMLGPNGAGKSTIWHLFTQTHYGASPNGAKKTDMQYDEEIKSFLMESTFQKNNAIYTAAHATKSKILAPNGEAYGSGVYLFRDGKDISLHKDPDTLNLIKQTMGWTLEEWYGYVYLAQATTHTLIEGTRSQRQMYLSALFNLLPLDALHKYCKGKSEFYDGQLGELEQEKQEHAIKLGLLKDRSAQGGEAIVAECRQGIEFTEKQLVTLATKQAAFDRKQVLELKLAGLIKPTETPEDLQAQVEKLQQQEAAYKAGLSRKQKLESELQGLPVSLEPKIPVDYEQVLATDDQNESALTNEIAQLQSLERSIKNLTPVVKPEDFTIVLESPDLDEFMVRQRLKKLKERPAPPTVERPTPEKLTSQNEKINNLTMEIRDLTKDLKRLSFGEAECDKCGTQLDVQHRTEERTQKQEELDSLQAASTKATQTMQTLNAANAAWVAHDALGPDETTEIPALEASVELFKKKKQYQALKAQEDLYEKEQTIKQQVLKLPELILVRDQYRSKVSYQQIARQKETHTRYIEIQTRLTQELSEIVVGVSVIQELIAIQAKLRAAQEIAGLETELSGIKDAKDSSSKIQGIKTEQQELQVKLGQTLRELVEIQQLTEAVGKLAMSIESKSYLQVEKTKYAVLTKGYGRAGQLREGQLKKFSRYLEEALLAHTIRQLPDHRFTFNVDDGIDIMTSKKGCPAYDVKTTSGGEKGALSLAFLFALDDLLPPDRRSNLKIVDEIEAAFDVDRKKDFLEHTLPELKKRAETVVVISHAGVANQGLFNAYWKIENGSIKELLPEKREYEEEETA